MAHTVGTCVLSNCESETCLLQARAQISRVLPTAVSPTRTHLTNSWWGCSLSMLPFGPSPRRSPRQFTRPLSRLTCSWLGRLLCSHLCWGLELWYPREREGKSRKHQLISTRLAVWRGRGIKGVTLRPGTVNEENYDEWSDPPRLFLW